MCGEWFWVLIYNSPPCSVPYGVFHYDGVAYSSENDSFVLRLCCCWKWHNPGMTLGKLISSGRVPWSITLIISGNSSLISCDVLRTQFKFFSSKILTICTTKFITYSLVGRACMHVAVSDSGSLFICKTEKTVIVQKRPNSVCVYNNSCGVIAGGVYWGTL